jgi:hypothetical protein
VSGVLDRLEALVAEFRACDAACDAGGMVWNGCQIAREVRTLIPLLRAFEATDASFAALPERVPIDELTPLMEATRRRDEARVRLLAALRTAPAGEPQP